MPYEQQQFAIHLFHEGKNYETYKLFSPEKMTIDSVAGWYFRLWAPRAKSVSVVGSFNDWNRTSNPMVKVTDEIWECFVTSCQSNDFYGYSVEQCNGNIVVKSDPYSYYNEAGSNHASILYSLPEYRWSDYNWMANRKGKDVYNSPMNIYEVHLGSWKRNENNAYKTYRQLAQELSDYAVDMGYTHIELLPVTEYPYDGSWGYQCTGMFAPTSRYGAPEDFMYFVDCCHQKGLGVILDWVPSHFPKDAYGLYRFDGAPLYEYADPRIGEHPEWGTVVYDYGKNEVRSFLISSANYWLKEYHLDGIRVDAVASMLYLDYCRNAGEWVPNKDGGNINLEVISFLKELNTAILSRNEGAISIAEDSSAYPNITKPPYSGGLGFNFKWNMGWMNDTLRYVSADPIFRKDMHNLMTFSIMYAFNENFVLPISHDEVVHGKASLINKMAGFYPDKFAALKTYLGYMMAHPGKKLCFMGTEFGQFIEWNYNQGLDWLLLAYPMHSDLKSFVRDLNNLYKSDACLWSIDTSYDGFNWIEVNDNFQNIFAFQRNSVDGNLLIAIMNFSPVERKGYWLGVPYNISYRVVLDSNAKRYGGQNPDILKFKAEKGEKQGRDYHITLDLAPNSVIYLKPYKRRSK